MIYKNIVRPILLKAAGNDPERLHEIFAKTIHWVGDRERLAKILEKLFTYQDESLEQEIWGLHLRNFIGLAAGIDKNAIMVPGIAMFGSGFHEIGTVTPNPQEGYSRPRIFYLPEDEALINRMGFPNRGSVVVSNYLRKISGFSIPLIASIAGGIDTPFNFIIRDYLLCLETFYPLPIVSAISVDVSCPHMPGLCELREKEYFEKLISSLKKKISELEPEKEKRKPILVKISPDDSQEKLNEILDICLKYEVDGIIVVNTTNSRQGLKSKNRDKDGGLSGKPLFKIAVDRVRYIYKYTKGKIPIIGVGGIFTAEDAYEMLKAGASLVQVYTGFVYNIWKGPWFFYQLNKGLVKLMRRDGIRHISEIRKYQ